MATLFNQRLEDRLLTGIPAFFMMGCIGASLSISEEWPILDVRGTLLPTAVLAVPLWLLWMLLFYLLTRHFLKTNIVPTLIAGALILMVAAGTLSWAALATINCLVDTDPPLVQNVKVLRMNHSSGPKSEIWELTLAPWGQRKKPEAMKVSETLFRTLTAFSEPNRYVRATIHPGALNWHWYELEVGNVPAAVPAAPSSDSKSPK